jgi:hypothetical protein
MGAKAAPGMSPASSDKFWHTLLTNSRFDTSSDTEI